MHVGSNLGLLASVPYHCAPPCLVSEAEGCPTSGNFFAFERPSPQATPNQRSEKSYAAPFDNKFLLGLFSSKNSERSLESLDPNVVTAMLSRSLLLLAGSKGIAIQYEYYITSCILSGS